MHLPPWSDIFWPTWALVGVGIVGTVAALCTLRNIAEQTGAIKASTDALINSERAWIFAEIETTPGSGRGILNQQQTAISIRVKCRNVGNAPAWISGIRAKFEAAKKLPPKPQLNLGDTLHAEPFPIAPNDPLFISSDGFLQVDSIQGLDFVGEIFVVYGVVQYRDTFSDNRETTFGYRLKPGTDVRFERLTGYPEYNKNT